MTCNFACDVVTQGSQKSKFIEHLFRLFDLAKSAKRTPSPVSHHTRIWRMTYDIHTHMAYDIHMQSVMHSLYRPAWRQATIAARCTTTKSNKSCLFDKEPLHLWRHSITSTYDRVSQENQLVLILDFDSAERRNLDSRWLISATIYLSRLQSRYADIDNYILVFACRYRRS